MILEVDMGNSRLKWRLRDHDVTVQSGSDVYSSVADLSDIFSELQPPNQLLVASVVPSRQSEFRQWSLDHWQLTPFFAEVSRQCMGVQNGYNNISQMGVDRWLAVIAAFEQCETACLVIDSGSALTVDLVRSDGQHLGGYIVPGLSLMREALFRDTDRVKPAVIGYDGELTPGLSTQLAVSSGLQLMHLGLIESALMQLLSADTMKPELFVTGGGGKSLANLLETYLIQQGRREQSMTVSVQPALVLDGLSIAYTHHLNSGGVL